MAIYKCTAFEKNGEKLLDETIEAANDTEAKEQAVRLLTEKNLINKTHRLVSSEGKLILFHE